MNLSLFLSWLRELSSYLPFLQPSRINLNWALQSAGSTRAIQTNAAAHALPAEIPCVKEENINEGINARIIVGSALVNNVVLSQFLGLCPFLGVSKKTETAAGMGGAVIFVITLSSFVTSVIYQFILVPTHMEYLQTIVFILVIAALVQFVEMFLKKAMPSLYQALGVYLPLITTNCAVLGVALINVQKEYNILQGTVNGFATAVGFTLSIIVMAGIREKIEYNDIPESFRGFPIVLITAGLMAIAFFGFSGLI